MDDLVKIINYFITYSPKQRLLNVGYGKKVDLLTIAQMIKKITNSPYDIQIKIPGYGKEYSCDTRLLKKEFYFTPTHLYDSIEELYAWYANNKHSISMNDFID